MIEDGARGEEHHQKAAYWKCRANWSFGEGAWECCCILLRSVVSGTLLCFTNLEFVTRRETPYFTVELLPP